VSSRRGLDRADQRHRDLAAEVRRRVPRALDRADQHLAVSAARIGAYDPARTLARGWSITRTEDGRLVRDPGDAPAGTRLRTTVADGEVTSVVEG
jgi:exodeoxyribonuclease VII large subunit